MLKQGSGVVSKDDLDAVENKIPNFSSFVVTADFNSKITEVENKIPDVINLVNKSELRTVENEIPDASSYKSKI